ncbi:hypothetical protein E1B28_011391 [Marasmius oreades]|uniref:Uncharacterized protein n=1 Tax=Marasmius oreades TaxID=181124 RepID=A0A9P7RUL6_9AGAR|nr:uncharacterized protein E1B28_011391 [Marasmius oreades]KAG7089737.1 hypothetical protein E1B28_011391 [Marasmius oreades]
MTVRCLPHAIHLAVRDFLVTMKAAEEGDIDENEVEVAGGLTEEIAECIAVQDRRMAEMPDEELLNEQNEDGIDVQAVVQKIRQISKISRSSPQRSEDFKKTISIVNAVANDTNIKLKLLNLILDVVTHWNSTFFMVKRAQELQSAIDELCIQNDLYKKYKISKNE